jgi:hypothetical protein
MKVLCLQEVVNTSPGGVSSGMGIVKASAPQVLWFVLCVSLQQGVWML